MEKLHTQSVTNTRVHRELFGTVRIERIKELRQNLFVHPEYYSQFPYLLNQTERRNGNRINQYKKMPKTEHISKLGKRSFAFGGDLKHQSGNQKGGNERVLSIQREFKLNLSVECTFFHLIYSRNTFCVHN